MVQTDSSETRPALGTFSVSLAVADLEASRRFYETLGFEVVPAAGEGGPWDTYGESWLMLAHGDALLGLFQGMFEENILTFNPPDVGAIQRRLRAAGIDLLQEADDRGSGPASAMVVDPDGNPILLDQHD